MVCAAAGEAEEKIPGLAFDSFPYPISRTHVYSAAGTPVGKAKEMNSPGPDDFPPSTIVVLEDRREYPALKKGARYFFPSRNIFRAYRISEVRIAPYKTIQPDIDQLTTLLKTRPARVPSGHKHGDHYDEYQQLPDYPPRNAGHLVQLRMKYLDAPWGSGLFYICQFTQGPGNAPNNEELVYIFQGLTKDGQFYLSADFRITHPKLPRGIDDIGGGSREAEAATAKSEAILPKQSDDSFAPSLRKIRDWVSSVKVE
jgi:hypothetical protein